MTVYLNQVGHQPRSDRGTLKRVHCCGHRGYCNGFKGELEAYMCDCACHYPARESK